MLVYLNEPWEAAGGRLRLLRSATDLEDYAAEVPPEQGTMLAFLRSERSYHGHKPFTGERRSLQVNWMTDAAVMRREELRHRFSARLKQLSPFSCLSTSRPSATPPAATASSRRSAIPSPWRRCAGWSTVSRPERSRSTTRSAWPRRSPPCGSWSASTSPRRSEERRGGKEWVRTGGSRWSPDH